MYLLKKKKSKLNYQGIKIDTKKYSHSTHCVSIEIPSWEKVHVGHVVVRRVERLLSGAGIPNVRSTWGTFKFRRKNVFGSSKIYAREKIDIGFFLFFFCFQRYMNKWKLTAIKSWCALCVGSEELLVLWDFNGWKGVDSEGNKVDINLLDRASGN